MPSFDGLKSMRASATDTNNPHRDKPTEEGALARLERVQNMTVDWFIAEITERGTKPNDILAAYGRMVGAQMATITRSIAVNLTEGNPPPHGLTNVQAIAVICSGEVMQAFNFFLNKEADLHMDVDRKRGN